MRGVVVLLCALIMAGCSLPRQTMAPAILPDGESMLYQIRLSRWSEPRFSGLLALRHGADGFYYALLDATGVTLLSARVGGDGEHHLLKAYGPFQESSLPGLLSKALFRILIAQPLEQPCSRYLLSRFCHDADGGGFRKKTTLGLVTMWQVEYDQEVWKQANYTSPWIGFGLELRTLPSATEVKR